MAYRILIVDDEEDIRTVAAMALDMNPALDVRTCGSGAEGRQIAEWWQPHLILLDVRMPGLSGPETLNELRSGGRTASIPVIFFTAGVQKHERDGLIELGAKGTIPKPFNPMTLAEQIAPFLPVLESGGKVAKDGASAANSDEILQRNKPMKSLLYVSRSMLAANESDIEVKKIVATARSRNESLGITGALIFTHTHFAQYLEGPVGVVDQLVIKLQQDPRHDDVRVVCTPAFSRRYFSDWSMAYGGSSMFVSNLVKNTFEDQGATSDSDKLIRLMREFTNVVRDSA